MFDSSSPVPPAATQVAANAPSGPVTAAVDCCPEAAWFDVSRNGPASYFGFDNLSNKVAQPGQEYWNSGPQISLPSNKETRDGAVWVSVPVGEETELTINFKGAAACIGNCTYEIEPATVAEVVAPTPTASGLAIKIKGVQPGEASLKVMCNGKLRGYFHIWCQKMVFLDVSVGVIQVTSAKHTRHQIMQGRNEYLSTKLPPLLLPPLPPNPPFTVENLETALNNTFMQALISCSVTDVGIVDFDQLPEAQRNAARNFVFDGPEPVFMSSGSMDPRVGFDKAVTDAVYRSLNGVAGLANAHLPGKFHYRIWYLRQPDVHSLETIGAALETPSRDGFMFATGESYYSVLVHEFGHMLGLKHVNEPNKTNKDQLPDHLRLSDKNGAAWHPDDPTNAMGYNSPFNVDLLYSQWKAYERVKTHAGLSPDVGNS
ncbi:MAG: matrixin family metalloprotease [Paracoccus denitrificans]|uniref:Matrixin family metalloprotease n=1 Tax=Paracoccus denitrificans TaxID=266 RepID=A0A533I7L7_PARDE|nr:MAG: matrixin family metalloprotease [Paracoccus denitrificans]